MRRVIHAILRLIVSTSIEEDTWQLSIETDKHCSCRRQYDPYPDPNTTTGTPEGMPVKPWKGEPISDYIKRFKKFDLLAYMEK